jgi:hypothetical protein
VVLDCALASLELDDAMRQLGFNPNEYDEEWAAFAKAEGSADDPIQAKLDPANDDHRGWLCNCPSPETTRVPTDGGSFRLVRRRRQPGTVGTCSECGSRRTLDRQLRDAPDPRPCGRSRADEGIW